MYQNPTNAYTSMQKETLSGRELEASVLTRAGLMLKQVQEIISLKEHVIELDKVQALFQTDFVAFRREHAVDAEMTADIAQKFDVIDLGQPVGVVEQECPAVCKIDIFGKLFAQALRVVINLFAGENLAHFRFPAGITDHGCTAA